MFAQVCSFLKRSWCLKTQSNHKLVSKGRCCRGFVNTRTRLREAWQQLTHQRWIHAGFCCSSEKFGFQVVLRVWFVAVFWGTVCPRTCSRCRLGFESQDVAEEWKKPHLIEMMRKYKRDFALPTVFQCLTLLHFVSLICWSCKLGGVGILFYFVFAQCFVQYVPFSACSYTRYTGDKIKQMWGCEGRGRVSWRERLAWLACRLLSLMSCTFQFQ